VLPIADRWFELEHVADGLTRLWEPHVIPLLRCNIWHVRGRDRDLMIDTGLGVASLYDAVNHLIDKPITAVATHTHLDHVGGHHEFQNTLVHELEADNLRSPAWRGTLLKAELGHELCEKCAAAGYHIDSDMITAVPHHGYELAGYRVQDSVATDIVQDGDTVDLGNRTFEILHLPGHSPGSIGLWDPKCGTLFSGDAIYDGPLLDEIEGSNVQDYVRTMKRLRELPVQIVHAGHEQSFGRDRLIELIDAYLETRT
jgi:glyoxylase-like metal-dependent hydrolase (beta-lactamase superfamily II)